jgi:hypothetical protein
MTLRIQNLDNQNAIVDARGFPTPFFIRFIQDRGGGLTDLEATIIALQEIIDIFSNREIIAGDVLNGGGKLFDGDVTLDHDTSLVVPGTYGDSTNIPQITVDEFGHIQEIVESPAAGGGGGGSGLILGGVNGSIAAGTTAQATKGVAFIPSRDMSIHGITFAVDPAASADSFYTQISTGVAATGVITTVLGTTPAVVPGSTNMEIVQTWFAAPIALTAGTEYILTTTFNQGSGTAVLRAAFSSTGTAPNAPFQTAPKLGRSYSTVGVSNGQVPSASTTPGDVYILYPIVSL